MSDDTRPYWERLATGPEEPDPPKKRRWARYYLRRAKEAGDREMCQRMHRYLETGLLEPDRH